MAPVDNLPDSDDDKTSNSTHEEGWWYLIGDVGHSPLQALVDSGASMCLIDCRVFEALEGGVQTTLVDAQSHLKGVNDQELKLYSETVITITIQDTVFNVKMVVADLGSLQAIIGMDFFRAHEATLDL